jgi:acetyl esterase/lipase
MRNLLLLLLGSLVSCSQAKAPASFKTVPDLDYAGNSHPRQRLNLYVPKDKPTKALPLVVYIHGGGWEAGNKNEAGPLLGLLDSGKYAGASIGYRLTDQATWPAQLHDCKAALRWLRAHASEYGYDSDRIAVYGISAGGHLASLLGLTADEAQLSGKVGPHSDQATKVSCVVNFAGPTDFSSFFDKTTIFKAADPKGPIAKLLGGVLTERPDQAKEASPVTYVRASAPPFLVIHGTADNLVPLRQSQSFDQALDSAGATSTLLTATSAPHVFFHPAIANKMQLFLGRHLLGQPAELKDEVIPKR